MRARVDRIYILTVILVFMTQAFFADRAFGQKKTLLYQGTWHGVPCSVTINWDNYKGLGNINGEIFITGDKSYQFTGINSVPGQLEMLVPGDPVYQFTKRSTNGKTTWALVPDGGVVFSRSTSSGGGGSGLPGAGGSGSGLPGGRGGGGLPPNITGGKPDPETTLSSGTWGGSPVSVTINWDNYAGQGPVAGHIQYNGTPYPFTGKNPRRGYMEIKVDGVSGTYRLNKNGAGATAVWSGSLNGTLLSFSRSVSVIPGGGGPPQNQGNWVIACEASRDKTTAERNASTWRIRGFTGACVVHKSEYRSMDGDQNWWITCAGRGSYSQMKGILSNVQRLYSDAYGIKADQSASRETFH